MSDNFWVDILKGKMIVSGLKQEPEKTYREIKCLNCKYWQKVPLITEYNQDGTKKHPAFCDECGDNLDAQEQVRKNKRATSREQVKIVQGSFQIYPHQSYWMIFFFLIIIPVGFSLGSLFFYQYLIHNDLNNPILDLFLGHLFFIYLLSFLFNGSFILSETFEGYPNSLKEYLFGYTQLGFVLLDLILFIGWCFGFWGDFSGKLTDFSISS